MSRMGSLARRLPPIRALDERLERERNEAAQQRAALSQEIATLRDELRRQTEQLRHQQQALETRISGTGERLDLIADELSRRTEAEVDALRRELRDR